MIEKTFPASDEALTAVQSQLEAEMEKVGCSMKTIMQVSVVIEEVFVNIAHYAYAEPGSGTVRISFDCADGVMTLRFQDSGTPFDPLAREDPDITLSAEERSIGGLGILMLKKMMDEVSYEYRDGYNTLTMTKKVS